MEEGFLAGSVYSRGWIRRLGVYTRNMAALEVNIFILFTVIFIWYLKILVQRTLSKRFVVSGLTLRSQLCSKTTSKLPVRSEVSVLIG